MLLLPTDGRIKMLAKLITKLAGTDARVGTFKNNYTPVAGSLIGNFTPSDYTGYAGLKNCTNWSAPTLDTRSRALSTADILVWTHGSTGAAQDVYGYYVVDAAGDLLWAERDIDAPVSVSSSNPLYAVVPTMVLGDISQCIDPVRAAIGHNTVASGGITANWSVSTPDGALLVAVLHMQTDSEDHTAVVPTGWTEAVRGTFEQYAGFCFQTIIMYKANAAPQSVTPAFAAGFGNQKLLQVAAFTNMQSVPLDVTASSDNGGGALAYVGPTAVTTGCKDLCIASVICGDNSTTFSDASLDYVSIDARSYNDFYGQSWNNLSFHGEAYFKATIDTGDQYWAAALATFKLLP